MLINDLSIYPTGNWVSLLLTAESLMNFFEFENLNLKFKNILNSLNLNLKYFNMNQIYFNVIYNIYK